VIGEVTPFEVVIKQKTRSTEEGDRTGFKDGLESLPTILMTYWIAWNPFRSCVDLFK
jgi:hypothetical protein